MWSLKRNRVKFLLAHPILNLNENWVTRMNLLYAIRFSLMSLLLLAHFTLATEASKNSSQNRNYDALLKSAKLKIALFKLQLERLHDRKFNEKQLEKLRRYRMRINKTVDRFEFIYKIREREEDSGEVGLASKKPRRPKHEQLRE